MNHFVLPCGHLFSTWNSEAQFDVVFNWEIDGGIVETNRMISPGDILQSSLEGLKPRCVLISNTDVILNIEYNVELFNIIP